MPKPAGALRLRAPLCRLLARDARSCHAGVGDEHGPPDPAALHLFVYVLNGLDGRARRILHRFFTPAPAVFTRASPSLWYASLGRGRRGGRSCRANWAKVAVTPLCQRDVPLQLAIELY